MLSIKNRIGPVKRHVLAVAEEIDDKWDLHWIWGAPGRGTGDHARGLALDFMLLTADQKSIRTAVGSAIAAYLQSNAARLGIQYIIWRRRIWNATRADDRSRTAWSKWRQMEDRGNITANHMDHVHVSFKSNATYYPPPTSSVLRTVSLAALVAAAKADPKGKQGGVTAGAADDVRIVEDALRKENLLSKTHASDGSFGSLTVAAYAAWQQRCGYRGVDANGVPGRASLTALGKRHRFTVAD